jgi:hypothetical protein
LDAHNVGYDRCGKLVVATQDSEIERLDAIMRQAQTNDVEGMRVLTADQVHALEPELKAVMGLESPQSGVFDSHGYMVALQGEIEAASKSSTNPHFGSKYADLNALREVFARCPALIAEPGMDALVGDLVAYKSFKGSKGVAAAARGILNLVREWYPALLARRDRGAAAAMDAAGAGAARLRADGEGGDASRLPYL